ncbi:LRRC56 [Symbiodinium natans]|uniref:LRRC56 protein n=1 Tax=Symbiodinium natans TaxID=878477 RepID=A0A812M2A4_9DINO|nr:LRRC56 [Symbiodinium natans]
MAKVRELGAHLTKLQVLWLGRCGLQDLDGLPLLEGLRELYLPFNDVVDVTWPKWLDHLQVLDLEGNAVAEPEDLAELTKCFGLRDLTVRGNPATFLPGFSRRAFFQQMPQLESLDDLPNFSDLPVPADPPMPADPSLDDVECSSDWEGRFLDSYLGCDLDLYMDLYLCHEDSGEREEGSWRQLLHPVAIRPRLADTERFSEEPSEEALILERLKAAPRGAALPQPSLSIAPPPCSEQVTSSAEGFLLRPPARVAEGGSVLTRGGAMAGAPLAALRQRRGLHGGSEASEAALLADLDIRELLRRYS